MNPYYPTLEEVLNHYGVPFALWFVGLVALFYWGDKSKMFNRIGWMLGIKNPVWRVRIPGLIFFIAYVYIFQQIYNYFLK